MDEFNAIFNGVDKKKLATFYKNVRTLTGVRKNKSHYGQNLINLSLLFNKLTKSGSKNRYSLDTLNKNFTMKDYKELFSDLRHTLAGGRSKKSKITNLYKLGQKTRILQSYFDDFKVSPQVIDWVSAPERHVPPLNKPKVKWNFKGSGTTPPLSPLVSKPKNPSGYLSDFASPPRQSRARNSQRKSKRTSKSHVPQGRKRRIQDQNQSAINTTRNLNMDFDIDDVDDQ